MVEGGEGPGLAQLTTASVRPAAALLGVFPGVAGVSGPGAGVRE